MKAKLINENTNFNREGKTFKKLGIGKKEELYLSKIQEFFDNIDIEISYYKNDIQWVINFSNTGLKILDNINSYAGIYENDIFLLIKDDEINVFDYKVSEWQDFCRGVIEEIIGGGIKNFIKDLNKIQKSIENIYT